MCSSDLASANAGETGLDAEYRLAQASISTGYYQSCAITSAGGLQCWGSGSGGRIGDGTENSTATPVDVVGLSSGVEAVSAGSETTCALVGGGAKCWGARVGDGVSPYGSSLVPVDVQGMTSGVRQVDVGNGFTCFVTTSSNVQCLGDNGWGQLGDGTRTSTDTVSTAVQPLTGNVSSIASGGKIGRAHV